MKKLHHTLFIFVILILSNSPLNAQVRDTAKMMQQAISYIDIKRDTLKQFWSTAFVYKKNKKDFLKESFQFRLSKFVCFKSPAYFLKYFSDLPDIRIDSTPEIIGFAPYISRLIAENKFYDSILTKPSNVFVVNFSKPANNFVFAEITLSGNKLYDCSNRFIGETIRLVFIFDEKADLSRVHLGKIILN